MLDTITKRDNPVEWALILKAIPNYRKRSAFLSKTRGTVTLSGRFWDGGSISYWHIIENGYAKGVAQRQDFPFRAADEEVQITPTKSVVCGGVFCGKNSTAHLYIWDNDNPE